MPKSKKKINRFLGFLILGMLTLIILGIYGFHTHIYELILQKQFVIANQISDSFTESCREKIEETFSNLELLTHTLKTNDQEKILENLKSIQQSERYIRVGFVDQDKQLINSKGDKKTIDDSDYYTTSMKGERYLSDIVDLEETQRQYILLSVPVKEGTDVIGVLYVWCDADYFINDLDFADQSIYYFQIAKPDGKYISKSHNDNVLASSHSTNLWEEMGRYSLKGDITLDEIKKNVNQGQSGYFELDYQNNIRYVTYESLGINDWYIFTVLTNHDVFEIIFQLNIFTAILVILFIVIGYFMYHYFKKTSRIIDSKREELIVQNKILNSVLENTMNIPFLLDLNQHKIKLFYNPFEGEMNEIELKLNAQSFIDKQLIQENTKSSLQSYFNGLESGLIYQEKIIPFTINDKERWMKIKVLEELPGQDAHYIGVIMDFTDEKNMNEILSQKEQQYRQLVEESKIDELTQILSRKTLENEIEDYLIKKPKAIQAFCIIDIDYFKTVNDKLGHIVGDQVLKDVAKAMSEHLRNDDVIGRLGGDEFICLIKDIRHIDDIHNIIKGLNQHIEKTYTKDDQTVHVTCSIGVALYPMDGHTFQELYKKADIALYNTKSHGRNGYTVYEHK